MRPRPEVIGIDVRRILSIYHTR